jgi:hypothetical protein
MSDFNRGIKNEAFLDSLRRLASGDTWWRDVLVEPSLIIAVRDEYLNVYWRGQSIFRVSFFNGAVMATTHPKYLLNPDLSGQISLVDSSFELEKIQATMLTRSYEGPKTLGKLKRAAGVFSGREKEGVHAIATSNPSVVDVEIALSANGTLDVGSLPRLDLAAFEPATDHIDLVFWEAKIFDNPEANPRSISIQIGKYQKVIESFRLRILDSYRLVARNLVEISEMSGGVREVSGTVREVAAGTAPLTTSKSNVGVIVYDYDADQQKPGSRGETLKKQLALALCELGIGEKRLRFRGDPKGLRL